MLLCVCCRVWSLQEYEARICGGCKDPERRECKLLELVLSQVFFGLWGSIAQSVSVSLIETNQQLPLLHICFCIRVCPSKILPAM